MLCCVYNYDHFLSLIKFKLTIICKHFNIYEHDVISEHNECLNIPHAVQTK